VTAAGSDFDFRDGLSPNGRVTAREALGYVEVLIREVENVVVSVQGLALITSIAFTKESKPT
jgi:hypothetical protein